MAMTDDKLASHTRRVTAALNDAPDAEELRGAAAKSHIATHVAGAVLNHENSDKVTLYLARNPEELRKLNRLSEKAVKSRVAEIAEQQENGGDLKDWIRIRDNQQYTKRGRR